MLFYKREPIARYQFRKVASTTQAVSPKTTQYDFQDYPAVHSPAPPYRLDLNSNPVAKTHRTILKEAIKQGPNFAGKFLIAGWGCGSSCITRVVIDTATGKVFSPKEIATTLHNDNCDTHREYVRYSPESRLLLKTQIQGEKAITSAFEWTGTGFILKNKYIQDMQQWCSSTDSTNHSATH
jgi:hypothetical protein